MACKLHNDLKSHPRFKNSAETVFNLVHTEQFKRVFGDWAPGANVSAQDKQDDRLDEFGYPTIKSVIDVLDNNDILNEDTSQDSSLQLGSEYKAVTRDTILTDLIIRVKQRIKNLRTAKKIEVYGKEELSRRIEDASSVEEARKIRIDFMRSKYVADLEMLSARLEKFNDKVAIKDYLKTVRQLLKEAEALLGIDGALDLATIYEYDQRIKFLSTLNDVAGLLAQERDLHLYVTETNTGGQGIDYNELLSLKIRVEKLFKTKAIEAIANKWGSVPGKATAMYYLKYEKEYARIMPFDKFKKDNNLTGVKNKKAASKAYKEAKGKSIAQMMDTYADIIKQAEIDNFKRILNDNPKDISGFAHYFLDARNMNNDLISVAAEILDKKDYLTMRRTIDKAVELDKLWKEFKKNKRTSDMRALWNTMIAKTEDGKITQYLVNEIKHDFWVARKEALTPMTDAKAEFGEDSYQFLEAKKAYIEWYKDNVKGRNEQTGEYSVKSKWVDPAFKFFSEEKNKNNIDYKMYWFLRKMISERDAQYPSRRGLKFPAIQKTVMEAAFEDGFIASVKRSFKDKFTITGTDIDYYKEGKDTSDIISKWEATKALLYTTLNEHGQEQQKIPVYYRQDDKVPVEEQSYDLASIFLMDYWGSVNYEESSYVQAELEVLKQAVGDSKVGKYHWGKVKAQAVAVRGEDQLVFEQDEGKTSNVYKNLSSLISDRLYGIKQLGSPGANKVSSLVLGWTADTMLIFNYYSATASIFQSRTVRMMRGLSGHYFDVEYGLREMWQAEKKFTADTPSIMGDVGAIRSESITNLLGERFQAMQDWSPANKRFMAATKLSQLVDKDALHGLHAVGEHYVQHLLMYTFLSAIRVQNSKGEFIDKNGKVVADKNKAMSFDQLYETDGTALKVRKGLDIGSLVFNTGKVINITNNNLEDAEFKITRHLFELNYYINGNYTSKNQAVAQRSIMGKHAYAMRRWLLPSGLAKYRGIDKALIPEDKLTVDDYAYSRQSEEFSYGSYVETFRFLHTVIKTGEALKTELITNRWESLSERKKADIHRTVVQIAEILLSSMASSLLYLAAKAAPNDEEKKILMYGAFFTRRLYSELSFFLNIGEFYLIMKSPAASVSMLENIYDIFGRFFGTELWRLLEGKGLEKYKAGKRKRQTKLFKEIADVIPIINQLDRDVENTLKYLYKNNN